MAARAACCAGRTVNVVSFAATAQPAIAAELLDELGIPRPRTRQMSVLPPEICADVAGAARNAAIKAALLAEMPPNSLVMAQPYMDEWLEPLYQIPPKLTNWLNDKANMPLFVPQEFLPGRLGTFADGAAFAKNYTSLSLPCVVKVSSSSSGDGVYLCQTPFDLANAAQALQAIHTTITAEMYIAAAENYAIHFGIPADRAAAIDILGYNEQYTAPGGSFIGGVIRARERPVALQQAEHTLLEHILPAVRHMGWYGVGGFDILVDEAGGTCFIDGNFRMTGMSAYHMLLANGILQAPMVGFQGAFTGSQDAFRLAMAPLISPSSGEQIVQPVALSRQGDTWRFNAALYFTSDRQLHERAARILAAGMQSEALRHII